METVEMALMMATAIEFEAVVANIEVQMAAKGIERAMVGRIVYTRTRLLYTPTIMKVIKLQANQCYDTSVFILIALQHVCHTRN